MLRGEMCLTDLELEPARLHRRISELKEIMTENREGCLAGLGAGQKSYGGPVMPDRHPASVQMKARHAGLDPASRVACK